MKPMSSSAARKSVAGLAVAVCTLAAIPAAMAQSVQAPYYDPVRDVIVTPSSSAVITTTDDGSQRYSTPIRTPIYGTYYTVPRPATIDPSPIGVVQSSPGAVGGNTAVYAPSQAQSRTIVRNSQPSGAQPYYDAERDVMVTPSMSGVVPYVAGTPSTTDYGAQRPASTFELVVRNGRLAQGPGTIAVDHGSQVTMIVDSDQSDALRVDGYNLVAPVVPGQPMLLTFVAEQPGRFAYRLGRGREIGVLEVGPPQPPSTRVGMN